MTIHSGTRSLPVVDLSRFTAPAAEREAFLTELRHVLHDHGFFYLVGHGVDPKLIADTVAAAKTFFALPVEEKLKIEMVNSPRFRGYTRIGREYTRGQQDWREQIDIGNEAEALELTPTSPAWQRVIGPNQWPEKVPELKPLLLAYQDEVTRVGISVLRMISAALGAGADAFADVYTPRPNQFLKIIRYPGRDVAETSQGVGAHKDSGLVTVLLQDVVEGLRVQDQDGSWIPAPPVPGTFVINTGELLELATNGFIRADVHDVLAPPPGVERFSVAFVLGARLDSQIPVLDLAPEVKAETRGVTVDPLNPMFNDVGRNFLKSRLRSHPDVARRHHADLLTPEELAAPLVGSAY